ncbi:MAG: WbqC family protein [Cyclobacteriaceae bacterium]
MKIAIMQPYFLPYIGYFQLINVVDKFVIYDNVQFVRKGWINRNRILVNGKDEFVTIPLKKDSDYLDIDKRQLTDTFNADGEKILRRIKESYRKAPYFEQVFAFVEDLIKYNPDNLFSFVFNAVMKVCVYLEINTELVVSSSIDADHSLKSEQRVLSIVTKMNAQTYVNAIGGQELYSIESFKNSKVELKFIQSDLIPYKQFNNEFVPWLSILDVMMFNSKDEIKKMLQAFTIK